MTIHILCTARRRGSVTLGPFTYCVPIKDRVGWQPFTYCVPLDDVVGDIMTIHIFCTARRRGRVAL